MPSRVIREALDAFPCSLIQGYGQTEGTTMTFLSQEDHNLAIRENFHPERLRSCGREGFVTTIRIVDADGNVVPQDNETPGEIIVKSKANMIGYFGRPDLTSQTIRNGWMWTGDIATWDSDGYCYIVDRAKDMIISGGANIYPAEIESVFLMHPKVQDVAVFGIPNEEWGEEIKAVVELNDEEITEEDIKNDLMEFASENLAKMKHPRSIDLIDKLPRDENGKLFKRKLRDPYWENQDRQV